MLRRKTTGEKGPATELEPGTYILSQNFSHELLVPATNLSPATWDDVTSEAYEPLGVCLRSSPLVCVCGLCPEYANMA